MPDNGELKLAEALENAPDRTTNSRYGPRPSAQEEDEDDKSKKQFEATVSQWSVAGNGRFHPVGRTIPKLAAGVYSPLVTQSGPAVEKVVINSDGIYTLPDMATEIVVKEIETFWNSETLYREHNLLYKRGVILWGPPGSGKSITVKLLMNEIIKRDGIVFLVDNVEAAIAVLKNLRRIEPTRNIILVYEDIDEIINYNGESTVLSLLDGEHNIDNVLNLATTNYPELLGARIINRPSRFDRRIYVDMPSQLAREEYLTRATKGNLKGHTLGTWVKDTEGMSIAHLRELVAAVYCLGQNYESVVDRLKAMAIRPKSGQDGWAKGDLGFQTTRKGR